MNRISIQRRQRKWTASKRLFTTYSGILSLLIHDRGFYSLPIRDWPLLSYLSLLIHDFVFTPHCSQPAIHRWQLWVPWTQSIKAPLPPSFLSSSSSSSTLQLNSSTQLTHLVCTYSFLLVYPGLMDTSTLVTHLSPCLRWSCTTTAAVERISRTTALFQTISPHINSTFSQRESGSSSDTFRLGFSSCHLRIAIHSSTLRDLQSSVKDDSQQTSTPPILFQFPSK